VGLHTASIEYGRESFRSGITLLLQKYTLGRACNCQACLNLSPGGLDIKPGRIYLITQDQCVDCPAAKAVVTEALDGSSIPLDIVDLKSINPQTVGESGVHIVYSKHHH
ncbi:MAG: hypothetical protein ACW99U_22050, partial [Candidatus Thorarchaeota archaeon]